VWIFFFLERGADCLHIAQLMPLHLRTPSSRASFKSRLVLPFWCRYPGCRGKEAVNTGVSSSNRRVLAPFALSDPSGSPRARP